MRYDTNDTIPSLRQGAAEDQHALGELRTATGSGSSGWSACASTAASRAGSTPPTSSRRPSSTSPAGPASAAHVGAHRPPPTEAQAKSFMLRSLIREGYVKDIPPPR